MMLADVVANGLDEVRLAEPDAAVNQKRIERSRAGLLRDRIERHGVKVWLVNTGWSGGPYGVGERISLAHTRALVRAALAGELDHVAYRADGTFGLAVPLLIFGAGSLSTGGEGGIALTAAISLVRVAIAPFAGGAAIRAARES